MRRSDISQLAEEAIKLAQATLDPAVRENLIKAAESLKNAADHGLRITPAPLGVTPEAKAADEGLSD